MSSIPLIVALALLLAMSAFFSASETSYTSFNRIRMKSLAEQGDPKAVRVLGISENFDRLLSTVLIGNNIVNILSTSLATILFVGWLGNIGVTVSTIVMTLLVLMFGEVGPKAAAKENPESFAMFAAPVISALSVVLTPVSFLMNAWQRLVLKLFKTGGGRTPTEQELLTYVQEVREEGGINEQEEDMIRTVIEFDDLDAEDILTPRVDIEAIETGDDPQEIAALFHESGYSRVPVYEDTRDNIIGVLLQKDFHYYVETLHQSVREVMRPVLFVPKTVKISTLLGDLQRKKIHMAVVVDEHGGVMGIVTIEDIVEELVGEIWDEHDEVREEIMEEPEGHYLIYGGANLGKMFEYFGIKPDSEADSLTVGGWAIEQLGRIPQQGECFTSDGLDVTVAEMRRNRVESVRVTVRPEPGEPEGAATK